MFSSQRYSLVGLFLTLLVRTNQGFSISSSSIPKSSTRTRTSSTTASYMSSSSVVEFRKYHGLGNDFILIDDRDKTEPSLTPEQSEQLCNRNFGIGGDGVIFALQPPSTSAEKYDFTMRIYNSDGSEPEMCGNGIRCMAQFLQDLEKEGGDKAKSKYVINTLAGPIIPVMNDDSTITVDMGEPILKGLDVPTTLDATMEDGTVVEQSYTDDNGKTWKITCVSMGNPHAIIFVNDLEQDIDFTVDGPTLEKASIFPAKTNVEFVQVLSPTHLKMKVWERGAGPTLACGTGACALTVAAILAQKIARVDGQPIRVTLPGGDLFIEWRTTDNKIYMTGPATFAFKGTAAL